jgi:predicted  nucleic acid-binding Zn-ribbon protein
MGMRTTFMVQTFEIYLERLRLGDRDVVLVPVTLEYCSSCG